MSTLDFNAMRRDRRARRRSAPSAAPLEALESRQLMAYSPLGYSLPDLAIPAVQAGRVAAYGSQLEIKVSVQNLGASTIVEPTALEPGATSTADAPPSVMNVYMSASAGAGRRGSVLVGTINVPAISQNDVQDVVARLNLPDRPAGFPGPGGSVYLTFEADANNAILEQDESNNFGGPVKVQIARQPALPDLQLVNLGLPGTLQPGDTIKPLIQIGNFGTAETAAQGPVEVLLVASVTRDFTRGSSVVGSYTIQNVPPLSSVGAIDALNGPETLDPPANVVTLVTVPVTLPTTPSRYYLGVVIDPDDTIRESNRRPRNALLGARMVGAVRNGLPPANVAVEGVAPRFPIPRIPIDSPVAGAAALELAARRARS